MKNSRKILSGVESIVNRKWTVLFPLIPIALNLILWNKIQPLIPDFEWFSLPQLNVWLFDIFIFEITITEILVILIILGTPPYAKKIKKQLSDARIEHVLGDMPILTAYLKNDKIITYEFFSKMITLPMYRNSWERLETALNVQIYSFDETKDKQHVAITCLSAKNKLPEKIEWHRSYLSQKDFELVLGVSLFQMETIDINDVPHIILGGGSGSGKTILTKLLLAQCIDKGATVYLQDFKGGIDYPQTWHKKCLFVTTQEDMDRQLATILAIMEERRDILVNSSCHNIHEYNKISDHKLNRIIIACDEAAEVLDKTALDKNQKALVSQIEKKLLKVSRQGRAFGIHLLLVTQRPSADIISGELKANMQFRVCGRCDKILSQIILDNSNGAEKVPPNGQGMFLTNRNVLFKAFYIDDSYFEKNN